MTIFYIIAYPITTNFYIRHVLLSVHYVSYERD